MEQSPENDLQVRPDLDSGGAWLDLRNAAVFSLVAHLLAGTSMALILCNGLDSNPDLPSRLEFISKNKSLWIGAWLTWNLAAPSILYFYYMFTRAHATSGDKVWTSLFNFALLLAAAGIAIDLSAQSIAMIVLTDIADQVLRASDSSSAAVLEQLFLSFNNMVTALSGYIANGLYTIAAIILIWSTRKMYSKVTTGVGAVLGASGVAVSVCSLVKSTAGLIASNAVLVPAILLWQLLIFLDANRRHRDTQRGTPQAS